MRIGRANFDHQNPLQVMLVYLKELPQHDAQAVERNKMDARMRKIKQVEVVAVMCYESRHMLGQGCVEQAICTGEGELIFSRKEGFAWAGSNQNRGYVQGTCLLRRLLPLEDSDHKFLPAFEVEVEVSKALQGQKRAQFSLISVQKKANITGTHDPSTQFLAHCREQKICDMTTRRVHRRRPALATECPHALWYGQTFRLPTRKQSL
eukprot:1160626-Pelagomonas_calceolata.AAC.7